MATVDFSDVVTYDGAAILAQASFSAAENSEPTPTERLWELVTNAVAFLADHYGADRDEFIPSVLALAMPPLLECKTPLNPEGQMDLVEQGIWGRPFRGQQVFGIRDAARKVARGDYDEWMMSAWVETDEGIAWKGEVQGASFREKSGLMKGVSLYDEVAQFEVWWGYESLPPRKKSPFSETFACTKKDRDGRRWPACRYLCACWPELSGPGPFDEQG